MRTLIISMTCGEGHNQIAKAIKRELDDRNEESKIIQLYGYSEKEISRQNKAFLSACKYIPHLYSHIWHKLRKRDINKPSLVINNEIKKCKDYILQQIKEYNPDNIICVHTNAGAVVSYLKEKGLIDGIKTYNVVFDYCLCPYWEFSRNLDYVVLPADYLIEPIKEKGFKDDQILTFGLPVDKKYTKEISKLEARETLNLPQDVFTIVLYSGGNCLSSAYKIIKHLEKCKNPIQIVAICGKNKKEYEKIQKYIKNKNISNIRLEGFCTQLDLYYSACDLVFTRGGGMGLTEQINKHAPIVLREKLLINENINKKLFKEMGAGLGIDKVSQATKLADYLIGKPEILKQMRKKLEEISKPTSTKDFVDFLIKN